MRIEIRRSSDLPRPNMYVRMLNGEFAAWAYDEERAVALRGRWRARGFGVPETIPLDLEIGTDKGFYFVHHAIQNPERLLLGIELKYKPLIHSIRRALRAGCKNARVFRYDAASVGDLFVPRELNDVIIHFPDPWENKNSGKTVSSTMSF